MLIDVHTHVVPEKLPDFVGRSGGNRWPVMDPIDACNSRIMISGKNFRDLTDQSWSVSRRLEDMATEGVGRQVLSPMPNLFSYWGVPGDTLDFSRFINEEIATCPLRDKNPGNIPPDLSRQAALHRKELCHNRNLYQHQALFVLPRPVSLPAW